jgi:hypothetical protein
MMETATTTANTFDTLDALDTARFLRRRKTTYLRWLLSAISVV